MSQEQVHNQFKVFSGRLGPDNTLGSLAAEVSNFAKDNQVAAKSIGVEYLEAAERLVVTLGYTRSEPAYEIELAAVSLGKTDALKLNQGDFSALEQAMGDAAAKVQNIICHELYITDDNDFVMVFMTRK
ncbi:MAG: hypothetical protein ACAI44_40495 [Candidatus Sericytochromatia bacterium]